MHRLEGSGPSSLKNWIERTRRRDAFWKHGSVCEDYSAIQAATLAVGGWGDAYKNAVGALVENLSCPAKSIVGPWVHKYPHFAVPEPRIGFLQVALRWWDRWLKGVENGVEDEPALRQYLLRSEPPRASYAHREGEWIAGGADATRAFHLAAGRLSDKSPERLAVTVASPADCGGAAGEYCAIWLGPELPGDQRRDDALSACFDAALEHPLRIVGRPRVSLSLRSDRAKAQIAVRLCDVAPDGTSARITYGVLNLADDARPGSLQEITLDLDAIAYEVPADHTLRLAVSTAYWPLLWPSPERAEALIEAAGSICRSEQAQASP